MIKIQLTQCSERQSLPPFYLKDYLHQVNSSINSKKFSHNKSIQKTNYPIGFVISYNSLSKEHLNYTLATTACHEPQT